MDYNLPAGATSSLCFDVLRSAGLNPVALGSPLNPIGPCTPFVGRAFTVRGAADSEIDADLSLQAWTRMLSLTPSHAVLVIEPGDVDRAYMGELSAHALRQRGCPAAVVDGPCRDTDQIRELGFPVFCRGTTPRDVVGAWKPLEFGEPVKIMGQVVTSADLIIGDSDGLCIVAEDCFPRLVEGLTTALQSENKVRTAILKGQDPYEAYLAHRKF